MSPSHLFLGLPIALLVLFLELSSGFHSATFFSHLSLGDVAILSASFHFIFFVSLVPATNLCAFPLHLQCFFFCIQSSLLLQSITSSASSSNVTFTVHVIVSPCALAISAFIINATHFIDVNFSIFFFGPNIFVSQSSCISFLSG